MNSMKIKYTELLNVTVIQKFYENNICRRYTAGPTPDLIFAPATETQQVMKRMSFIFKGTANTGGFTVLAETNGKSGSDYLLRFSPKKADKLTFFIVNKNPDLFNYNDLPAKNDSNKIYYFTNQISGDLSSRTNLHLTKLVGNVDATKDQLKKSSSVYTYHHTAPITLAGTVVVKHLLTNIKLEPISLNNPASGGCDLVFDLSALPLGKVELIIAGTSIETFYYTGKDASVAVIGVIELSLSDTLEANYRIIETDQSLKLPTPVYSILLINRQTTWRYTFKLTPASPLFNEISKLSAPDKINFMTLLKIVCNDNTITFSQSSPDANTIIFVSNNPLALHEKYTRPLSIDPLKFVLTKYTGVALKEAAVKENLPYPENSMLDARNPAKIYSDIFLTL